MLGKNDALRTFEKFRSDQGDPATWTIKDDGQFARLVIEDVANPSRHCVISSPGVDWIMFRRSTLKVNLPDGALNMQRTLLDDVRHMLRGR